MRLRALFLFGCIAFGAASGCRPPHSVTTPATPPEPDSAKRQEMSALAFIAYLGESLQGSDDEVERQLFPCLTRELAKQPLTRDKWTLAWGPAVYKFALADLDDNMMYVVRDAANPAHLAIAVRGTNAKAILDWLIEDFEVHKQAAWPYGNPPRRAKIAKGTSDGLRILQTMVAASGPAPNQTLSDFLAGETERLGALQIDVTGHSLGGALSPTLTLWLADTRSSWDPSGSAQLAVYPLAGPTAGNVAFAAYSDSRIGVAADRLHNPFDVVPLAWNVETMGTIADLYEPLTRADEVLRSLIDGARDLVKHKGYSQIMPDAPPLPGALNDADASFLEQVGWQHTCGYHCALGLVGSTFLPVTLDCNTDPPSPCPVCPSASQ
ncbi:MAG TPA: hypothetical protein VF756_28595 [Thermoanaerobaculia bacterium]